VVKWAIYTVVPSRVLQLSLSEAMFLVLSQYLPPLSLSIESFMSSSVASAWLLHSSRCISSFGFSRVLSISGCV